MLYFSYALLKFVCDIDLAWFFQMLVNPELFFLSRQIVTRKCLQVLTFPDLHLFTFVSPNTYSIESTKLQSYEHATTEYKVIMLTTTPLPTVKRTYLGGRSRDVCLGACLDHFLNRLPCTNWHSVSGWDNAGQLFLLLFNVGLGRRRLGSIM